MHQNRSVNTNATMLHTIKIKYLGPDSIAGRMLALHTADLGSILSTPYAAVPQVYQRSFLSMLSGIIPEHLSMAQKETKH